MATPETVKHWRLSWIVVTIMLTTTPSCSCYDHDETADTSGGTAILARTFIAGGDATTIDRFTPYSFRRVLVGAKEHAWISTPARVKPWRRQVEEIPDEVFLGPGYRRYRADFGQGQAGDFGSGSEGSDVLQGYGDARNGNTLIVNDERRFGGDVIGSVLGRWRYGDLVRDETATRDRQRNRDARTTSDRYPGEVTGEDLSGGGRDKQLLELSREELSAFMDERNQILEEVLDTAFRHYGIASGDLEGVQNVQQPNQNLNQGGDQSRSPSYPQSDQNSPQGANRSLPLNGFLYSFQIRNNNQNPDTNQVQSQTPNTDRVQNRFTEQNPNLFQSPYMDPFASINQIRDQSYQVNSYQNQNLNLDPTPFPGTSQNRFPELNQNSSININQFPSPAYPGMDQRQNQNTFPAPSNRDPFTQPNQNPANLFGHTGQSEDQNQPPSSSQDLVNVQSQSQNQDTFSSTDRFQNFYQNSDGPPMDRSTFMNVEASDPVTPYNGPNTNENSQKIRQQALDQRFNPNRESPQTTVIHDDTQNTKASFNSANRTLLQRQTQSVVEDQNAGHTQTNKRRHNRARVQTIRRMIRDNHLSEENTNKTRNETSKRVSTSPYQKLVERRYRARHYNSLASSKKLPEMSLFRWNPHSNRDESHMKSTQQDLYNQNPPIPVSHTLTSAQQSGGQSEANWFGPNQYDNRNTDSQYFDPWRSFQYFEDDRKASDYDMNVEGVESDWVDPLQPTMMQVRVREKPNWNPHSFEQEMQRRRHGASFTHERKEAPREEREAERRKTENGRRTKLTQEIYERVDKKNHAVERVRTPDSNRNPYKENSNSDENRQTIPTQNQNVRDQFPTIHHKQQERGDTNHARLQKGEDEKESQKQHGSRETTADKDRGSELEAQQDRWWERMRHFSPITTPRPLFANHETRAPTIRNVNNVRTPQRVTLPPPLTRDTDHVSKSPFRPFSRAKRSTDTARKRTLAKVSSILTESKSSPHSGGAETHAQSIRTDDSAPSMTAADGRGDQPRSPYLHPGQSSRFSGSSGSAYSSQQGELRNTRTTSPYQSQGNNRNAGTYSSGYQRNKNSGSLNSGYQGNRNTGSQNSGYQGNRNAGSLNNGYQGNRNTGYQNSGYQGNRNTGSQNTGYQGNQNTGPVNSGYQGNRNTGDISRTYQGDRNSGPFDSDYQSNRNTDSYQNNRNTNTGYQGNSNTDYSGTSYQGNQNTGFSNDGYQGNRNTGSSNTKNMEYIKNNFLQRTGQNVGQQRTNYNNYQNSNSNRNTGNQRNTSPTYSNIRNNNNYQNTNRNIGNQRNTSPTYSNNRNYNNNNNPNNYNTNINNNKRKTSGGDQSYQGQTTNQYDTGNTGYQQGSFGQEQYGEVQGGYRPNHGIGGGYGTQTPGGGYGSQPLNPGGYIPPTGGFIPPTGGNLPPTGFIPPTNFHPQTPLSGGFGGGGPLATGLFGNQMFGGGVGHMMTGGYGQMIPGGYGSNSGYNQWIPGGFHGQMTTGYGGGLKVDDDHHAVLKIVKNNSTSSTTNTHTGTTGMMGMGGTGTANNQGYLQFNPATNQFVFVNDIPNTKNTNQNPAGYLQFNPTNNQFLLATNYGYTSGKGFFKGYPNQMHNYPGLNNVFSNGFNLPEGFELVGYMQLSGNGTLANLTHPQGTSSNSNKNTNNSGKVLSSGGYMQFLPSASLDPSSDGTQVVVVLQAVKSNHTSSGTNTNNMNNMNMHYMNNMNMGNMNNMNYMNNMNMNTNNDPGRIVGFLVVEKGTQGFFNPNNGGYIQFYPPGNTMPYWGGGGGIPGGGNPWYPGMTGQHGMYQQGMPHGVPYSGMYTNMWHRPSSAANQHSQSKSSEVNVPSPNLFLRMFRKGEIYVEGDAVVQNFYTDGDYLRTMRHFRALPLRDVRAYGPNIMSGFLKGYTVSACNRCGPRGEPMIEFVTRFNTFPRIVRRFLYLPGPTGTSGGHHGQWGMTSYPLF